MQFQVIVIQSTICCHLPKAIDQPAVSDKKLMMRDFAKKLPRNEHKSELVCSVITKEKYCKVPCHSGAEATTQ